MNKDLEKSPVTTTAVSDNDKNLFWAGLPWHQGCYSNEITPLIILLAAVFLGTGNSSKIVHGNFLVVSLPKLRALQNQISKKKKTDFFAV